MTRETIENLANNAFAPIQHLMEALSPISYLVLTLNLVLIFFARPILNRFSSGDLTPKTISLRIMAMRAINVAMIGAYAYSEVSQTTDSSTLGIKLLSILTIIYCTYLTNYFVHYYIFKTYGKQRKICGKSEYIQTYQTRAFGLLSTLSLSILALITCIHQMGADSLLQAGGVVGVIGITIGLTQQAWAPDIISGLILLHSDAIIEGDVIELPNGSIGLVYKTKMFHTEILNLANNHRIMIRNAMLRDLVLHNLSKFASAKGLRECLKFNIGYNVDINEVKALFEEATEAAVNAGVGFEKKRETEVKLFETGDHAITWGFIYYVKSVEKLVIIRRDMREIILSTARKHDISLATPMTHTANIDLESEVERFLESKF